MTKEEYLESRAETYDALEWFYKDLDEYVRGKWVWDKQVVEVDGKRFCIYIEQLPDDVERILFSDWGETEG